MVVACGARSVAAQRVFDAWPTRLAIHPYSYSHTCSYSQIWHCRRCRRRHDTSGVMRTASGLRPFRIRPQAPCLCFTRLACTVFSIQPPVTVSVTARLAYAAIRYHERRCTSSSIGAVERSTRSSALNA